MLAAILLNVTQVTLSTLLTLLFYLPVSSFAAPSVLFPVLCLGSVNSSVRACLYAQILRNASHQECSRDVGRATEVA